jgi:hypothetical protein
VVQQSRGRRGGAKAAVSHSAQAPVGAIAGRPAAVDGRAAHPASRTRRIVVRVIIFGTTLLAVLAIFAVWANRELLSPGNWGDTSTKLLQNPAIRDAAAVYLVEQLYANVNVEEELRTRLPREVKPIAGPLAGGLRSLANEATKRLLERPRVQEVWRQANRAADQTFVNIVNGRKGTVLVNNGEVALNLAALVKEISKQLGLPDVSSKLPPTVAHLRILKSDQIAAVQKVGKALKGLALVLTILVPVLYALAILLARGFRRRALMSVGFAAVFAGVAVLIVRGIIISQVTDSLVKAESVRPAARSAVSIGTLRLSEIGEAFIIIGVPLIAAAWFAGPGELAVRGRRAIAPFLRSRPEWSYGIVAILLGLLFLWNPIPATGKPAGIIIFSLLAFLGMYVLRRQTDAEFPAAALPS